MVTEATPLFYGLLEKRSSTEDSGVQVEHLQNFHSFSHFLQHFTTITTCVAHFVIVQI